MSGNSWVTLATNDSYSLGALVLAHSLKRAGTIHNLTVMVTPGVSTSMRNQLVSAFNVVQEVNILDSKDEENLALLTRPELGVTFTKLHCWRLTQFSKCVFLDADVLVLCNCDELFEREELSAAPDVGWPDCFNSGVFVYRPSVETYNAILNLALSQGSFDGGDQGLLNQFFSDWATKDISRHLPFIYNMCSSATYSYLPAFKQFGQDVKIVHFIGSSKPWLQYLDSETRQVRPTLGSEHLQGYLQLWWDIFCNDVHSILTTDMAGLAGALSQLTLGVARSPEQSALEEHLRKQAWEHGNIDYMGRDSFDNIWRKICQTLSEPIPDPLPEQCDLPSRVSSFTVCTVPQEVISDDVPLPSLPQTQFIPSENKEIKDAGQAINTSESKPIEEGVNVLQDESSSKLAEIVEAQDNISETQLICNVDQNVSPSSSTVKQSTSVLPSEQMYIVDASCLKENQEANVTVNLPGIVSSSDTNSEDILVSSCLEYGETLDAENLSQGNIVAHDTPPILSIASSHELPEVVKTNVPVAFPDHKPIDRIVDPSVSELQCNTSPEVSNILVGFQANSSILLTKQVCPPELVESIAYPKISPETAGLVECETDVQNVPDVPHLVEDFQINPLSEVKEGESKSFDTTISQVMRVIESTPPTSPSISLVPEKIVSCETNVLTVDSSIPDTPPLDSHSSKTPLGTSEVPDIASTSVPQSSLTSESVCTNDPKAPVPPKRRHRPSQRGQRGKK